MTKSIDEIADELARNESGRLKSNEYVAHLERSYRDAPRISHSTLAREDATQVTVADVYGAAYLSTKYDADAPPTVRGSIKHDADKPNMEMFVSYFPRALLAAARPGMYGAEKYVRDGWGDVPDGERRYLAAALRHLLAVMSGQIFDTDPLTARTLDGKDLLHWAGKLRHDDQAMWNIAAWRELRARREERDGKAE